MSYDIYYIRSNKLTAENVDDYLESEPTDNDEHFISKELMVEVKAELAGKELSFETFEGNQHDYLELNFKTYQIEMSNSQIAILLPYWDVNSEVAIRKEVELISESLVDKGFTGYDPQTGEFFTRMTSFSTDFDRVNQKVSGHFSPEAKNEKTSEIWRLIKVGIIFVVVFLAIKLLFSLISKVLN